VNENRVYNDGVYEYEGVGFPFFKGLGEVVYGFELGRERFISPNFERF